MTWADLIFSSVPARLQYLSIGFSLALLLVIIHLIRRGLLKEGYSIIWFLIAVATVILSIFSRLLDYLAELFGIAYTPAALFLVLLAGLFLLAIHFSVLLSRYDRRIRELAQEHAILKAHVELRK